MVGEFWLCTPPAIHHCSDVPFCQISSIEVDHQRTAVKHCLITTNNNSALVLRRAREMRRSLRVLFRRTCEHSLVMAQSNNVRTEGDNDLITSLCI